MLYHLRNNSVTFNLRNMPVTKIPVVYKFGIVSSDKKLELQQRLQNQSYVASNNKNTKLLNARDPTEVTEEFVQLFNSAVSFKEKEKYEDKASKLLERAKRRSGVRNCGQGSRVNLPLAWTEMIQLAQCKGRVQEESLDILVTSLEVSSLERFHIPALFFLAETMLYCLRTEEVLDPFLRTREIKLLKMGQLVFERLFYHHMTGQLQEYMDCKSRLCTYTDGLEELHEVYDIYPNALLYLKFITEVGRIILADCQLVHGDTKSDEAQPTLKQSAEETNLDTKHIYEYYSNDDNRSNHSAALSSSVHDLSPTLWHALDVFRCTNSLSGGLRDALKALDQCGFGLATETWVDGIVAIKILGESSKTNMAAMEVLHNLALGVRTREEIVATLPLSYRSAVSDFSIICNEGESMDLNKCKCEIFLVPPGSPQNTKVSENDHPERRRDNEDKQQMVDTIDIADGKHMTETDNRTDWKQVDSTPENVNIESKYAGCQLHHVPGIRGWHWEVAFMYTEVLENIVLYGSTAAIQKHALVGSSSGNNNLHHHHHHHQHNSMSSAGLVDLAFFNSRSETLSGELSTNDWSWRIRFGAMQSLVKICRSLKGNDSHEGIRTAAWTALLEAKAREKDCRVLEALKVAQIHRDSNTLLDPSLQDHPVSLEKHIATRLSTIYLPPIPPPVIASPRIKSSDWSLPGAHVPVKPSEAKLLRTTLKQELNLAAGLHEPIPDYNTRKDFDLRRIVEDQWRKELHAKLEEDKQEELQTLKEQQQKEEDRQRKIETSKQQKFRKKSVAFSGQEKELAM